MMDERDEICDGEDLIDLGPTVGDSRACIRHTAEHEVRVGFVRPVKEGEPVNGKELITLEPREDGLYKVQSLYGKKPAKVNSPQYRKNWDSIFSPKNELN